MDIYEMFRTARTRNASDVSLIVNSPPLLRIYGILEPIEGLAPLTAEDVFEAFSQLTTAEQGAVFQEQMELDFGYTVPDVGRLRCNAAQQLNGISLAIRLLPAVIPTIDELELPQIYNDLVK